MKKVLLSLLLILGLIGSSVMVAYAEEVVDVVSGIKYVAANTTSTPKYNSHWQYWSQGASGYPKMRQSGCRVVAYAKLLAEIGYADFGNPDNLFLWGIDNGFFNSTTDIVEKGSAGVLPTKYVKQKGGTLKLEGAVSLKGNNKTDAQTAMDYINQGYYVVLCSGDHFAYVGRQASLDKGTPVILESFSDRSQGPNQCQTYRNYTYHTFEKLRYYSTDTPVKKTLTMKYNANGGSVSASGYSQTSAGMIQLNGSDVTRKWDYGSGDSTYGLVNATTFGLTKSGYSFVGWSRNKNGSGSLFDQDDTSLKAETIYPDVKNGSATVTLYAVWAKNDYANIYDGYYALIPKNASGMRLDINGASTENGANAQIYTHNCSPAQIFQFTKQGDYYLITAVCSGKNLNVKDGGKSSKTNVQQWAATGVNSQWRLTDAGGSYYYIRPVLNPGLCLDVAGGKTANSTNVQIYMMNYSDAQKWELMPVAQSYLMTAYDNYSGKNYLYNTDFNTLDSSHWVSRDTSVTTLSVDKSNTHNGHNSLKIVNSSAGAPGKDLAVATTTQNSKNHDGVGQTGNLVLSFWAKSSVAGTKMFFRWGYESTSNYRSVTLTTDWQKYTVTMNKTADFNHYFHPYINQAGTVWIAEVQLEDGTIPTEFVPETGSISSLVSEPIGAKYFMPDTPTREGYTFDGWYTTAKGGTLFSSSAAVKAGDVAVYAHWTKNEEDPADGLENPFVDVDEDDEFYDAVMWAYYADPQITNGIDATHFGPMKTVTRGQCAAFLWRAMGCPEPESTYNPFKDVSSKQYYYKPILWAVENGITLGTSADTYSPDDTLTTQHIVTFIYRTQNPGEDGWDGEAAEWAADRNGRPFGVDVEVNNWTPCPRAYVVMFLQQVE